MNVYVAGEGPHEIGKWAENPERRGSSKRGDGVLAALFRKVHLDEIQVIDGKKWSLAPKYRAGAHATADQRCLRQLAHLAEEAGAEVFLWSRDLDKIERREDELLTELGALREKYADDLFVVGGVAVRCLEAWIAGLAQLHVRPEELAVSRAAALVAENELDSESRMVSLIRDGALDVSRTPSLHAWLELARAVPRDAPL